MVNVDVSYSLGLLSKNRTAIMGFAILWIMAFHYPILLSVKNPLLLIKVLGYCGVDIFFFLSGFGLYFALSKKDFSLKEYYKKRFLRILPEYWLVLTILFIAEKSFSTESFINYIYKASTIGYWLNLLNLNKPFFLWYVSAILAFYTIYPFYFKFFKKCGIIATFTSIIVGFVFMMLYAYARVSYFNNVFDESLLILSISRIPIFFIGSNFGYLVKNKKEIKLNLGWIILIAFTELISFISLFIFLKDYQEYLFTFSLFFIPFITMTPVLSVFLGYIFEKSKKLNSMFSYFGEFSFEIYLWHETIFKLVHVVDEKIGKMNACLLVIFLSLAAARVVYKINNQYIQKIFKKEKVRKLPKEKEVNKLLNDEIINKKEL